MTTSSKRTAPAVIQYHESSHTSSEEDFSDDDGSSSSYERLPPLTHCSKHHEPAADAAPSEPQPEPECSRYPVLASSASVNTYDSRLSEANEANVHVYDPNEGDEVFDDDDEDEVHHEKKQHHQQQQQEYFFPDDAAIPPVLPAYRHRPLVDHPVRPSSPRAFAELFPSLDRLSVRHDDFTPDGNMNLRVETPVLLPASRRHRPVAFQLFHLRMHDLARRDFSLRRYCRGSGREVCSSKRAFVESPPPPPQKLLRKQEKRESARRPGTSGGSIQRSVSTAIRSVTTPFQRSSTNSSLFKRPGTGGRRGSSSSSAAGSWDAASSRAGSTDGLPVSSASAAAAAASSSPTSAPPAGARLPTDTIKLEFSNYARVEVARATASRSGATLYAFEWWGHEYAWRRAVDEHTDLVSYHLIRDGAGPAVAHIVPETRGLDQVRADESAGGWIPPCHMWISDESVLSAMTDVADVIIATGLIALVDDSIRCRWHVQAQRPSRPIKSYTSDLAPSSRPRSLIPSIFHRRHSEQYDSGPLRLGKPVAAY